MLCDDKGKTFSKLHTETALIPQITEKNIIKCSLNVVCQQRKDVLVVTFLGFWGDVVKASDYRTFFLIKCFCILICSQRNNILTAASWGCLGDIVL